MATEKWNLSHEREIRDLESGLRWRVDRTDQLWRMHERGPFSPNAVEQPEPNLRADVVDAGMYPCATCRRDFRAGFYEFKLGEGVVCWLCAIDRDPVATAQLLAEHSAATEEALDGLPKYVSHWIGLLKRLGAPQRSDDLRQWFEEVQSGVRRSKAARLSTVDAWLQR